MSIDGVRSELTCDDLECAAVWALELDRIGPTPVALEIDRLRLPLTLRLTLLLPLRLPLRLRLRRSGERWWNHSRWDG